MKTFKQFIQDILFPIQLKEAVEEQGHHVTHLSHVEDLPHEYGHNGGSTAIRTLHNVHNHIEHGARNSNLTTKIDGGVSIVTGKHPVSGKQFVAYKGALNKIGSDDESRLSFSHHDIDKNFADKPWLKEKMKHVLDHAHKILPHHGIYQGDFLFDHNDKHYEGNNVSFTPNTITYSANKNSAEGKKN